MREPTPDDAPDLIEMTAAAICNNDGGATWDNVRTATASRAINQTTTEEATS